MDTSLLHSLRMAKDCLSRASDGVESDLPGYALEQVGKATVHLSDIAFALQTRILCDDHEAQVNR